MTLELRLQAMEFAVKCNPGDPVAMARVILEFLEGRGPRYVGGSQPGLSAPNIEYTGFGRVHPGLGCVGGLGASQS